MLDLLPALRDLADGHRAVYASVSYTGDTPEIQYIGHTRRPNEKPADRVDTDAWTTLIEMGYVALPERGASPRTVGRCTVTDAGYRALAAHR